MHKMCRKKRCSLNGVRKLKKQPFFDGFLLFFLLFLAEKRKVTEKVTKRGKKQAF